MTIHGLRSGRPNIVEEDANFVFWSGSTYERSQTGAKATDENEGCIEARVLEFGIIGIAATSLVNSKDLGTYPSW